MTEHVAGGRTILFAPMIPEEAGIRGVVGSIERTAQVDIVVGADGAVLKDRHGDADAVLADLSEDIATAKAAAELEWADAAKAAYMYAVGQFASWWGARRAVRKAGGPKWAVKMSGRLALLVAAPQNQKTSGLDKAMIERVSQKASLELAPKVVALAARWDQWKAKRT